MSKGGQKITADKCWGGKIDLLAVGLGSPSGVSPGKPAAAGGGEGGAKGCLLSTTAPQREKFDLKWRHENQAWVVESGGEDAKIDQKRDTK